MTPKHTTIANHLRAAGEALKAAACVEAVSHRARKSRAAASIDEATRLLHLCFLAALGPAEELDAHGRVVVPADVHERGWQWRPVGDGAFAPPFGTVRACLDCGALIAGGPSRCVHCVDKAAPSDADMPIGPQSLVVEPAGWVVRLSNGQLRWLWMRASGAEYEPYATREDAQRIADTTGGEAVPVDGDGNVIEAEGSRADDASFEAEAHRLRIVADGANARCSAAEKERDEARSELAAVKAERDRLATELDRIRTDRDGLVTEMIAEGQSAIWMRQRLGVKDSETLREVVDRLAAEVQAAREQKPVRWALQGADGRVVGTFSDEVAARGAADRPGDVVAPLYLAPVVRDHSEVIAQCEEALKEWDRNGAFCSATSSLVAVTLTKARNALRGAP